jgi:hypothetical protein
MDGEMLASCREAGGWTPVAEWADKEELFSLILAQRATVSWAP